MMKIDDIKRKLLFFYNEQQNKNKAEESGDNKVDIQDLWGKQYEVTLHFTFRIPIVRAYWGKQ